VQIDHRGPDIGVAEQRLDRAEVVAGLEKIRGMGMTKGVGRDALNHPTAKARRTPGNLRDYDLAIINCGPFS